MKKKTSRQKAKDKAWKAFSRYIRARDCIRFTGDIEEGVCVTCKVRRPFKELQAGHFISGRGNAVLFDEEVVFCQCYGCNMGRGGAYIEYFVFMEQEYGREKIDEFRARKHQTVVYKEFDFDRIRREYEDKYDALVASL